MLFKNAKVFQIPSDFAIDSNTLSKLLADNHLRPPAPQATGSQGWIPPFSMEPTMYCLQSEASQLITMGREEKIIPPAAIKHRLQIETRRMLAETGQTANKRQQSKIREQILIDILPTALTKTHNLEAYIDNELNLFIVNTHSQSAAENLIAQLRITLGSFKAKPIANTLATSKILTKLLSNGSTGENIEFGDYILLKCPNKTKGEIRAKEVDFNSNEIQSYIENGYLAKEIGLVFKDKIEFTLTDDLSLKNIKSSEFQKKETYSETTESNSQFNSEFTLLTLELRELYTTIFRVYNRT